MDDSMYQRFGLALVIVGATLHLQAILVNPYAGWQTLGFALMVIGLLATGMPLGPPLSTAEPDTDDQS
ncbi:hypothetical protein ACFQJC_11425 [Haloferax namakaokahaiae]|uniref:Uncharacterized protein n=1 Tax=Haloferax namakaokahaiae TaxID=1748331 RepID=A0ABD5ZG58_9EURY